jgi:hypothetical protein
MKDEIDTGDLEEATPDKGMENEAFESALDRAIAEGVTSPAEEKLTMLILGDTALAQACLGEDRDFTLRLRTGMGLPPKTLLLHYPVSAPPKTS